VATRWQPAPHAASRACPFGTSRRARSAVIGLVVRRAALGKCPTRVVFGSPPGPSVRSAPAGRGALPRIAQTRPRRLLRQRAGMPTRRPQAVRRVDRRPRDESPSRSGLLADSRGGRHRRPWSRWKPRAPTAQNDECRRAGVMPRGEGMTLGDCQPTVAVTPPHSRVFVPASGRPCWCCVGCFGECVQHSCRGCLSGR
jgi:hypothetical protein